MSSIPRGTIVRGERGDFQTAGGHHGQYAPCVRCGRVRAVKPESRELCRDCRSVDPTFGTASYR